MGLRLWRVEVHEYILNFVQVGRNGAEVFDSLAEKRSEFDETSNFFYRSGSWPVLYDLRFGFSWGDSFLSTDVVTKVCYLGCSELTLRRFDFKLCFRNRLNTSSSFCRFCS